MRPEGLNPLFRDVSGLKGVGTALARPLEKLGLTNNSELTVYAIRNGLV